MSEVQSGSQYEEFLRQFTRERERVYAYIYALVPHQPDAEDIFQRCSLVLWRKFSDFRCGENFLAWACGVAHFEVRNYLRTAGRDRLQFDEDLIQQLATRRLESLSVYEQRLAALRACLKGLNLEQRQLIEVAYGNEGTIKRLAEATGYAVQTLYNRLNRLRRQLLECVERRLSVEES